jgi:hypothetical protein
MRAAVEGGTAFGEKYLDLKTENYGLVESTLTTRVMEKQLN